MDTVIISIVLTTLWLKLLYGNAFMALFSVRLIKSAVMFPINTVLLMGVLKPAGAAGKKIFKKI